VFGVTKNRKMLDLQHQYNNCTTIPHMRVGSTYWDPPSCEELLYHCCIGFVQESNPPKIIVKSKITNFSTLICWFCVRFISHLKKLKILILIKGAGRISWKQRVNILHYYKYKTLIQKMLMLFELESWQRCWTA
jgi:hypothetical protein